MRFHRPQKNEWVYPVRNGYKLACCDCGLVHEIDFRAENGKVKFRVRRNNRSTAMKRRHMGWVVRNGQWVLGKKNG